MTRKKKQIRSKVDAIFFVSIALTAFVSIGSVRANQTEATEQKNTDHETIPTVAVVTQQTTEPTATATKPTETETPETTPSVTLYNVPLAEDLQLHIIHLCEEPHIDPAIIFGMIYRESNFDASTIGDGGESFGLMQIQPRWHSERMERLGCNDLLDPFQNVAVGIDYLAEMLDRYDGDIHKALVAYNAGAAGAEKHWFSKGEYSSNYSRAVMDKAESVAASAYETECLQNEQTSSL